VNGPSIAVAKAGKLASYVHSVDRGRFGSAAGLFAASIRSVPAAWLLVAFRRECLRLLRRRTRSPELLVDLEKRAGPDSAALPLTPEERLHLSNALEKLPSKERQVIWQRFALGLTFREVAAAMGCKVVTAKKASAHALEALRRIYRSGEVE